ncbi:MAG: NB-ARC domain-containing protein [Pseudonocardia sp.]
MDLGPRASDDAGDGQDLVFVSYSHKDAEWAQRVEVLVKPLLRSKRLRLWVDTAAIRAGDEWRPEIQWTIERSRVALLLVSADFLASDFIMDHELPALIHQEVRLASVLVGECLWKYVPELETVQWLHDPGRDGALNLVTDRFGERDRRLREICDQLLSMLNLVADRSGYGLRGALPPVASAVPAPGRAVDAVAVAEVAVGRAPGELSEVPGLPPGYVERTELAALIDAIISADTGAVGLTGRVEAVGLHGQGGIGKSVLAVALSRDQGIRRRFPDGVYWISVGEQADVLASQLDLLTRLGEPSRAARTSAEALERLGEVLRDRRVLLVVDDVWSDAAAHAFRVTGPLGRVLYTTRDPQILTAVGARSHPVDVLEPAAARALAAGVVGVEAERLPADADSAIEAVGRVALAVALLAAAVRGGRSWPQVAADLARDTDVFGDHPYANTFKAMQIACAELSGDLVAALFSLAVFPPDIQIPVAAISRYWAYTRGRSAADTRTDLQALAVANVLRLDADEVGFHDLQHDYLLLHAPILAVLHGRLLDAYRSLLPDGDRNQWWRLPAGEPYISDHLMAHLSGSGDRRTLAATAIDAAYLTQRIATHGLHAAEADLTTAAAALPTYPAISWWRSWLPRHANVLAVPGSLDHADPGRATALAPTMRAWLDAEPSLPEGVDPDRLTPLLPSPHLTVRYGLTPPETAQIRVLTGHTGEVTAVAWSPDGTLLATASYDGQVRLWNPTTGNNTTTLTGPTSGVTTVAWSPDSTQLATAGNDGQVRLWNPPDDTLCDPVNHAGWRRLSRRGSSTPTEHTRRVDAVAWSPDGTRLATAGGDDGQVRLWNPTTTGQTTTLTGHTRWVTAVAWSPDGTHLATVSTDGMIIVYDLSHPSCHIRLRFESVSCIDWTRAGIALGGSHGLAVLDLVDAPS